MSVQYWVRRGERVHGPFSDVQIANGLRTGKLVVADQLGTKAEGPWRRLEEIAHKFESVGETQVAVVEEGSQPSVPSAEKEEKVSFLQRMATATEGFGKGAMDKLANATESVGKAANAGLAQARQAIDDDKVKQFASAAKSFSEGALDKSKGALDKSKDALSKVAGKVSDVTAREEQQPVPPEAFGVGSSISFEWKFDGMAVRLSKKLGTDKLGKARLKVLVDGQLAAYVSLDSPSCKMDVSPGIHVIELKIARAAGAVGTLVNAVPEAAKGKGRHTFLCRPGLETCVTAADNNSYVKFADVVVGEPDELPPAKSPDEIMYVFDGRQDVMVVYSDYVTITPKASVLGFLNKGFKGTKDIPFHSVTAIQMREKTKVVNGYLQFTIPGGRESKGGIFSAVGDENTVMFGDADNVNERARQIKRYIDRRVREIRQPQPVVVANAGAAGGVAEEIKKLAELREQGLISDEEFLQAKQKILAS